MALTEDEEQAVRGIIAIFQGQAASLSDDVAEKAAGLYGAWEGDGHAYGAGERVCYEGKLYVCQQAHTSQSDWAPGQAASLWTSSHAENSEQNAESAGNAEWEQPESTNPYAKGSIVSHNGKTWESLIDGNVWEPGSVGAENLWQEVSQ